MTATAAVVQIGKHGGRGFIILAGDRRYVVTAAHCIFDIPPFPHPARDANDVTYENLIGPLGGKRNVSAECVFLDLIADIAVYGTPDPQDRGKEAEAYEEMTDEAAFRIGKLKLPRRRLRPMVTSEARMLSLDGEWFTCKIMSNGGPIWFEEAAQPVLGGMSGSPIVLPDGSAVGVVCVAKKGRGERREGGPNPMLSANLPGWLLEAAR